VSGTRPHYPWKEGEQLFATELNAAIANMSALATKLAASPSYANDAAAAAAAGGVAVGGLYRNGSVVQVRVA
jgi:hypothetical protein